MNDLLSAVCSLQLPLEQREANKQTLIARFDKPGDRLKIRVMIEKLQRDELNKHTAEGNNKDNKTKSTILSGADATTNASTAAPSAAKETGELDVTDDEADDDGRDASSNDDEADEEAEAGRNERTQQHAPAATTTATASATPASSSSERAVWKEVQDKASGKPYWYNRQTKETTWSNHTREERERERMICFIHTHRHESQVCQWMRVRLHA